MSDERGHVASDIASRLWARTDRSVNETTPGLGVCWRWIGAVDRPGGYGTIWKDGRQVKTHRAAWALTHGEIPVGMSVLHRCDVPSCINPAHLFLGSQRENMLDMRAKGRAGDPRTYGDANGARRHPERLARGSAIHTSKLTEAQVRQIRDLTGVRTQQQLAQDFGINRTMVQRIQARTAWSHVP